MSPQTSCLKVVSSGYFCSNNSLNAATSLRKNYGPIFSLNIKVSPSNNVQKVISVPGRAIFNGNTLISNNILSMASCLGMTSAYYIDISQTKRKGLALKKSAASIIYGTLTLIGISTLGVAIAAYYIFPLFDSNIARVLIPMSIGFLSMICLDYAIRERQYD
jgi:hypothetical protein